MRPKGVFIICLLVSLFVNVPATQAQAVPPLVMACVRPLIPADGASYVIVFRNSTLFGLVIPVSANITIFSNQSLAVTSRQITTDASSGGYKLGFEVARHRTSVDVLDNTDCTTEIEQLSQALNTSVSQNTLHLPVAPEYGLTLQVNGEDQLTNEYLGVFGFQFQAKNDSHLTNFQVAQLSPVESRIEISLSGVTPTSAASFLVIGNKTFLIAKSGSANPDDFGSKVEADDFDHLKAQQKDMPALFALMQAAGLPICPIRIFGYIDPPSFDGGYLSLEFDNSKAKRDPEFAPGSKISILTEGIEARYYLPDKPGQVFGKLVASSDPLTVVGVDEQGRLIVKAPNDQEVVIEAWRVKATIPAPQ